uniref:ATP synthase F0 subunit 8 n=1 Tax=Turritella bacillum TaxID=1088899 RepID=A0A140GAZ6_9CAEN|nr:ATP synthase F0 subunit 8 [Turritella bacillum]AMM72631.1 ATP synthase F0 subunit 8 [Turritella bacillum]
MPQLSPLNWIFLFFLFWCVVFSVSAMIWWGSKVGFSFNEKMPEEDELGPSENIWSW